MRVYTYYTPIGLYDRDSQERLIDIWARSWSKAGWEPIVLNEGDAMLSPHYDEFRKAVWKLPTEYGHEYETTCFLRWLAMSAQETGGGGGTMTDYDVINYGFPPIAPIKDEMLFFCDYAPHDTISLGVVTGTRAHYSYFCDLFLNWVPHPQHDWNPKAKLLHCSDLSMLVRMFENKTHYKPEWAKKVSNVQAIYMKEHDDWKTAPLVHYGYNMKRSGHWPKWAWIEKMRPF